MKHIAILRQPFFDMILSGEKTIESRWSQNKIPPFEKVSSGDTIYLKQTGKNITAKAIAKKVEFYNLTPDIAEGIRLKYGKQIGTDKFEDWESFLDKKYLTLVFLEKVETIPEIIPPKSHGAGWIIIKE